MPLQIKSRPSRGLLYEQLEAMDLPYQLHLLTEGGAEQG